MSTHVVEMPEQLDEFIRAQSKACGFASPSEYIRAVLTEVWGASRKDDLVELIQSRLAAYERGECEPVPKDYFTRLKEDVLDRIAKKMPA